MIRILKLSIIMLLFFVSFLVLPWLSAGSYATHLGLPCGSLYSVAKEELKKTKVWKKCHESNKKMKKCVDKGMQVSDVGSFVDKDVILCEYVQSLDHTKYYTDKVEKEKNGILKKYKKSKEFKEKVEEMKTGYFKLLAHETSSKTIEELKLEYDTRITEQHNKSRETMTDLLSSMVRLTVEYDQKIKKKAHNFEIDYEETLLNFMDYGLPLHLGQRYENYDWTESSFDPFFSTTPYLPFSFSQAQPVTTDQTFNFRPTEAWQEIIRMDDPLDMENWVNRNINGKDSGKDKLMKTGRDSVENDGKDSGQQRGGKDYESPDIFDAGPNDDFFLVKF